MISRNNKINNYNYKHINKKELKRKFFNSFIQNVGSIFFECNKSAKRASKKIREKPRPSIIPKCLTKQSQSPRHSDPKVNFHCHLRRFRRHPANLPFPLHPKQIATSLYNFYERILVFPDIGDCVSRLWRVFYLQILDRTKNS